MESTPETAKRNDVIQKIRIKEAPYKILSKDILYIEVYDHTVFIHTSNRKYAMRNTLLQLEKDLEESGFIRIHIAYLVNQEYVVSMKKNQILLKNGELLPVSKYRKSAVKKIKSVLME